MNTAEANFWGMHAGRTGDADELFFKKDCVAIGWTKMGDLSAITADRDSFKAQLQQVYPEKKPGAIPVDAGQLFRFVHEMKPGDIVVYPSKRDRQVHLGRVEGAYVHDASSEASYPNRRHVTWLQAVPRTRFSQGALHEIGSAMSLFLVKNYVDEFRGVLEGKPALAPSSAQDESVAAVTEDTEEATRDFILKRLAQELKGEALEGFVLHLLECMGYHARLTRKNEPSVDIIAHKDHLGVEKPIIKVQVKSSEGVATDKDVSALYGKLSSDGDFGLFVTLGTFSPAYGGESAVGLAPSAARRTERETLALHYEQSKSNLRLIDGDELVDLIYEYYEHFDSRHKGILPLKRRYVPDPIETTDD